MAGSTRYYGLGFFDFGDPLGTDFAGQIEIDRFVFIDKQLYGLMSIFGNGVISGWEVAAETAFSVSISEGYGNINHVAARTEFPFTLEDIPPQSVNYVYARIKDRTTYAEDLDFVLFPTSNVSDPRFLLLAEIITGPLSIESIDNSIRQEIEFLELIRAAIKLHKHRGGSLNPSKIDLASEVKGQLPSFRIADFDAEKITTGTFDLARMPLLDHQDLANVGLLTHPQLDTFVKTLEASNKEIFGEIGTSNLLQLILAMKFIYDDPESAFYLADRTVDENMINEIAVIPGITPDSYIDFDNTTATVNTEQHYIQGTAPTTGTSFYVNWDTNLAWNSAYRLTDVSVANDSVTLAFNQDDESNIVTVENFESATEPGQVLSGTDSGEQELFRKETLITNDDADVTANSIAIDVIEGYYSGKFTHKQSFRVQYVKEYDSAVDWSSYDSFVLHVKCLDAFHGPVKLFFFDSDGEKSADFTVLDQDEITDNPNPSENNFEMREIQIAQIPFRTDIKGFVIYSDDTENPFHFFIDYINLQRAILLPEEGQVVLRYASGGQVTFSTIEWSSIEPPQTEIQVRVRSASGTALLPRAEWTPYLTNGALINLEGTDLEIEVTLTPNIDRDVAPVLQWLRILVLTEAEIDGYQINTYDEFVRGDTSNISVETSPTRLELDTPVYVDSYYFCHGNTVNQIVQSTTPGGNPFAQAELAWLAASAPIAPNQIFKAVEDAGETASVNGSVLFAPRSVRRQSGRTYLIADTFNDRILEYNEDGELVSGIGSINYEHSEKTFPIAASIDMRTGILYVVWSKRISFKAVDVSKIVVKTTDTTVQLIENFDKILGLTSTELQDVDAEGQIMPIHLSLQNLGVVQGMPSDTTRMLASSEVLIGGIDTSSQFYQAIVNANGIPCFIGNFAYIDGIFSPTYADKNDDGSLIITNGTIGIIGYSIPSEVGESISLNSNVTPIIEIDTNNNIVYGSDKMLFSPFVPGRAHRIGTNTLLIAGIRPGGTGGSVNDDDFNFRTISGDSTEKLRRKGVLNTLFFGADDNQHLGACIVLDTNSGATTFEYVSQEGVVCSDVDIDPVEGYFVVAETSFQKSGRIVKVDASGNIVFTYGEGLYGVINDVRVQVDGSMVIST